MEGAGEHSARLARRAFSFRLCRRLSIIALLVTTASRYLSHRLTPARLPLYWFLLGLQSLITYTCSWEMQAWLKGESPFDEVSPPTAGAFLELPPWSWVWEGCQAAAGQRWWGGGGSELASPWNPQTHEAQSSLVGEQEKTCL